MNFFPSCEHLLPDTTNVSQRVKNNGVHGLASITATGPAPACGKVRVCQPFVNGGTLGWKSQLPKADRCEKQTILDEEDNRKRGCGQFQTLSNCGFESVRWKMFVIWKCSYVNVLFHCLRLGCFIFIPEGCPSSAVASEGSCALKMMLCWKNSVIHYF